MDRFKIIVLVGVFFSAASGYAHDVFVSCMRAYDEGGAPAFFGLPECPQWILLASPEKKALKEGSCQFATLQGHKKYQEDRVICYPNVTIPVLDVSVAVGAVFDGHGGKEASKMASEKFLDYFFLHVVFNTYKKLFLHKKDIEEIDIRIFTRKSYNEAVPVIDDELLRGILETALLQTIQDIDSEFSQEAMNHGYISGSTATVVVWVNRQILVGSLGDSKALLCSRRNHPDAEGELESKLYAEELTRDHHPDREDEKARIEAAGGVIRVWGVPRVNGILAVTRSIGGIYLKRYGVIAEPEISWRNLTSKDYYIVIGTDGVFETMAPQSVCNILQAQEKEAPNNSPLRSLSSLADCIVHKAFDEGSMDNLSVIVIPIKKNAAQ
ncbi:PREDICTED: probable protein phosphatase 2C 51 [Ipomoea nil]|uniref:probable protein phosphatase 2C 51 n=1 Tax=Ipomoea nil TaxID=35883 RepID=UPI000901ADF3|nr:PREDICTED: probable protein phosphatase 2C 51 [Ipomoea nil]XP_019164739.1 PREDICTED: probable protein phosphatase 2C 51 [Ipomoea nil]